MSQEAPPVRENVRGSITWNTILFFSSMRTLQYPARFSPSGSGLPVHRRQEQKLVYFELFKASSARDKTRYIEESKQKAAQKTA